MAAITIEVATITFQNPDNGYTVLKGAFEGAQPHGNLPQGLSTDKRLAVVGELPGVRVGDILDVSGEWTYNAKFGQQFKAQSFVRSVAYTERATMSFLRGFANIGPARARAIVDHFGDFKQVIEVMNTDPHRLAEIQGLTTERAELIAAEYVKASGRRDAMLFLAGLPLGERQMAKIIEQWDDHAKDIITENPYAIMRLRGFSFQIADECAKALGVQDNDPRRLSAIAVYCLNEQTNEGHTYSTAHDILTDHRLRQALENAQITADKLSEGFVAAATPRKIGKIELEPQVTIDGDRYYLATIYKAEQHLARDLLALMTEVP